MIDRQSVKTTESRGVRGYDAAKRINGRKRHIIIDTIGLLVGLAVHDANIQDRDGARLHGLASVAGWAGIARKSSPAPRGVVAELTFQGEFPLPR